MLPKLDEMHLAALRELQVGLGTSTVRWVLTGSAGFAVQGVPVTVHDLDVQTDAAGAYEVARCFARAVIEPVHFWDSGSMRSHFGVLELVGVRVPEHIDLLFLPPYSPELQPAEHVWPLTNTVLVNRHFASIDELEDVQAASVIELCNQQALVRSSTLFSWYPPAHSPRGVVRIFDRSTNAVSCVCHVVVGYDGRRDARHAVV